MFILVGEECHFCMCFEANVHKEACHLILFLPKHYGVSLFCFFVLVTFVHSFDLFCNAHCKACELCSVVPFTCQNEPVIRYLSTYEW